jgi:hypothetical protein
MQKERFTKEDIRSGRDVRSYIAIVMRHVKAAEFPETIQQLSQAYNNLDPELRIHISRPGPTTTLSSFMEEVSAKSQSWKDVLGSQSRFPSDRQNRPPFRHEGRRGNNNFNIVARNEVRQFPAARPNFRPAFRPFVPYMNFRPQYPFTS